MSSEGGFRVAIIGVGLIGGSLGMAWRRSGAALEILGVDPNPTDAAVRLGAIDRWATMAEAVAQADLLLLAAPVRAIIALAAEIGPGLRPGTIVTDVGSTKQAIVKAWEQHLAPGAAFVGGHPLFGREVAGVAGASPDLPAGCAYVLTPSARSTPAAVAAVRRLAEAAGGNVKLMDPAEHDARVAVASHLPQLVATALAAAAADADDRQGGVLELSATGFRDTTRIAGSPADLWTDIFLTNPVAIRSALLIFRESLDALEDALIREDPAAIARVFARAHTARNRIAKG